MVLVVSGSECHVVEPVLDVGPLSAMTHEGPGLATLVFPASLVGLPAVGRSGAWFGQAVPCGGSPGLAHARIPCHSLSLGSSDIVAGSGASSVAGASRRGHVQACVSQIARLWC